MKRRRLIHAAAIVDALSGVTRPGAILIEDDRVLAAGSPESIGMIEQKPIFMPRTLLMPAFVNIHAHLDLTHLGPRPFDGSFMGWLSEIIAERAKTDDAIAASVRQGVELSRAGGTGLIGDIAGDGSFAPILALRESGMPGVSFLEIFGIGSGETEACRFIDRAMEQIEPEANGVRLGLQPHAPYSCGREVYAHAATHDVLLSTHLAESLDEIEFTRAASGMFADMLRRYREWDESIQPMHAHPVDALAQPLSSRPWIATHCNYVDDAHIEQLARWNTTVAYCPRASDYFGHGNFSSIATLEGDATVHVHLRTENSKLLPPHRYRDMLEAGVRIAFGTDSIVCLDRTDRISTLDDMRHLYKRDGTEPPVLLHMATIAGAEALGRPRTCVTFEPGDTLGVIGFPIDPDEATDPLVQVMNSDTAPEWIMMNEATARDTVIR